MTERNRKRILQELIESLLKEEKEIEHAYSLKFYNFEGYEKVIPLTKKTSAELPLLEFKYFPLLKFKYYSLKTKSPRRNRLS